jgi:hypothetical protein
MSWSISGKRFTWGLLCCQLLLGCNPAPNELDALFQQGKYEEFIAKVRQLDPKRQNRALDDQMRAAIEKIRLARCANEKDAMLTRLRELEAQGAYAELPKQATQCRDDPQIAEYTDPVKIFARMPSSHHLLEARRLSQDSGGFPEAKRHLAAIEATQAEYKQAQQISQNIARKEGIERAREKENNRLADIAAREYAAKEMERRFLDRGLDAHITAVGKDKTTLRLKYVLVSRPMVHQLANDTATMQSLRKAGFKKLILDDGYREQWTIDL